MGNPQQLQQQLQKQLQLHYNKNKRQLESFSTTAFKD